MRLRRNATITQTVLLALISVGALVAACRPLVPWMMHRPRASKPDVLMGGYRLDILWPNYFANGFIRRGLGGTLFELVRRANLMPAAAGYQILLTILLLVPLILLLRTLAERAGGIWLWFGALLVVSPQLFLAWGMDFGRSDMLTISFVAWAALALAHRRYLVAVIAVLIGSLAHETALFYGVPLIAAFAWLDHRAGQLSPRRAASLVALLLGGYVVLMIVQRQFGDGNLQIARTILAHDPAYGEHPAYMTMGGFRALVDSACMSFRTGQAPLIIVTCFAVLALYMQMLLPGSRRNLALLALVSFLPMAVMCVVAIDYGRWLMLAVISAWLAAVVLRIRDPLAEETSLRQFAIAILLLLALIAMKITDKFYTNYAVQVIANAMFGKPESFPQLLDGCDPSWRSVLPQLHRVQYAP